MTVVRLRSAVLSAVCVLLATCDTASDNGWAGTAEYLPNGAVRVVNPPEGLWTSMGPAWRLQPDVVIGEIEGEDAEVFGAISGLEVDASGRIYVVDRQANELRIFAPDGSHIRSTGRSGEGPGEFSNVNGLLWITPDTLLVVDQRGNRYSVYTRDGDYVRSVPRQLGFYGWVFSGGYHERRVYETYSIGQDDDRHPALLGTSIEAMQRAPSSGGVASDVESRDVLLALGDTILLPQPEAPLYESFSVRTDRGGMVMSVPFTARPVYNLDPTGDIWHGHGSGRTIYRSTLDGDTLAQIVLSYAAAPVTADELSEWESSQGVEQFRAMGGKLDLERIPKEKPFFDDIIVGLDGHIWLGVPAGPDETVFAVLDGDGRYLGQLKVDGVAREFYVRPIVRNDRVYWIGRDELDVQRVYVYAIDR